MRALVLEGIVRECLAVVRSLGSKGVEVDVGDPSPVNPARFSKYVSKFYRYPDPKRDPERFGDWLLSHVSKRKYDMVFPLNDYTYEVCTKLQDELKAHASLVVNEPGLFELARDKAKTLKKARELGISMPRTWFPDEFGDIAGLASKIDAWPVLLKPSKSSGSRGIVKVERPRDLKDAYLRQRERFGEMLVQDYIPGREILDVPMVFNKESKLRGALVNNRVRMYPVDGGPNVAGRPVRMDALRDEAARLMEGLRWVGAGLVEYKMDPRDNVPKLMEINPRLWGSTQLGISNGMDWPWMLFQIGTQGDCPERKDYSTDVLLRWLLPGELMFLLACDWRRDLHWDFLKLFGRDVEYYIWRKDDWAPFLGLLLTMACKSFDPQMLKHYIFRK